jgi:PAS domain S-box-containing protein
VGTGHGLYRYNNTVSRWQSFRYPSLNPRNTVNEIVLARDGSLWNATSDGLEIRFADGRYKYVDQIDTTHLYSLTGLCEDSEGNMWISSGSAFSGAFRWDGRQWKRFAIGDDPENVAIHKIRKDRDGNLWFLGIGLTPRLLAKGQPGAFVYRHGSFVRWGEAEGLLHGRVYSFAEGTDGSLWFGTVNGVSRWRPNTNLAKVSSATVGNLPKVSKNPEDGTWKYWTRDNGFRGERVFALAVDSSNRLWFSSWGHGGGLACIDRNDSLRFVSSNDGLECNYIFDICADESEKIWLATNAGLYCYQKENFLRYDTKSGLSYNELFCLLPNKGKLYVGTQGRGYTILDMTLTLPRPPTLVIEDSVVEEQNVLMSWKAYSYWGELVPSEILARYRLNDGSWSNWVKRSTVEFDTLAPGVYLFQVQAKGLLGQYDTAGARATFTILPPLYLRPIVLYPGIAAIVGIVGLAGTLLWRKRMYDISLRTSEERYRMITELMSDYAYLCSFDERGDMSVVWLTDSFTRVTGYTVEEGRAPEFLETIVYHEDIPEMRENIEQLLGGNPRETEGRIVTKQGAVRWMKYYTIPIFDKTANRVTNIYGIARDITRRKYNEDQLRRLTTELSQTEERERRRMANFLHDSISQSLLISKMKLEALRENKDISATFEKSMFEVSTILQQTIENSRTLTFDLCPPILYDLGLAPAVDWLAEQMNEAHNLNVKFMDDGKSKLVANELRNTMYTGAREALMNIVKHADAKNVWIDVRCVDDEVVLAIEDDGVGFDFHSLGTKEQNNGGGFGLTNLRERMRHLGGEFEIESAIGKGTRLTLTAPTALPSHDERKNP